MTDDLTCETAGCTRDVPNRERCSPCENAYFDGVETGVRHVADKELATERGVRGREEIREKLEEAKGEGVGLYSDVANHMIRVTLEWVLKQQDSLEEPVLGVRDEL